MEVAGEEGMGAKREATAFISSKPSGWGVENSPSLSSGLPLKVKHRGKWRGGGGGEVLS